MAIASTAANAAAKLGYKERDMVFSPVESRWNHDRLELSRRLGAILTADAATEPLVEYIRRREFRRRHWASSATRGVSRVALAGLARIVGGYAAAAAGARLFQPSRSAIVLAPYAITLSFVLLAGQIFAATSGGCSSIRC